MEENNVNQNDNVEPVFDDVPIPVTSDKDIPKPEETKVEEPKTEGSVEAEYACCLCDNRSCTTLLTLLTLCAVIIWIATGVGAYYAGYKAAVTKYVDPIYEISIDKMADSKSEQPYLKCPGKTKKEDIVIEDKSSKEDTTTQEDPSTREYPYTNPYYRDLPAKEIPDWNESIPSQGEASSLPTEHVGGYLDIMGYTIDEKMSHTCNIPEGVFIQEVVPNGAADEAGIEAQSIITELDGTKITTIEQLRGALSKHKVGDIVTLRVYTVAQNDSGYNYIGLDISVRLSDGSAVQSAH